MATVLQLSDTHLTAGSAGTAESPETAERAETAETTGTPGTAGTETTGAPRKALHGRDPAARLRAVVDAWLATGRKADLVLLSGDVADDESLAGCLAVSELVAKLRVPVLAIPGNHDSRTAVAEVFGSASSVELGQWRIVGVDSVVPGEVAGVLASRDLLDRLDSFDKRPTVVAVHHPPWSPSTNRWFRLPNWAEILAGLAGRPHVRAVVSGHLHLPFEEHRAGLALLGAPSTLYGIRHDGDSWQPDDSVTVGGRVIELGDDGRLGSDLFEA